MGHPKKPPDKGAWKAAWRTIGGQRCYFRSAWEANFARYLEFLRRAGEITSWEHEPHTFWFDGIRRGVVSYKPDFRVVERGGSVIWYEVKGWMDPRSATKIKRMAKYHPDVELRVIQRKDMRALRGKLGVACNFE